jgi:hypothetical protein
LAGRRVHSIQAELLRKSKEAALNAVQTFNNPLIRFKSESFIVLMVIAWTYLLHGYYRRAKVEYRYHHPAGSRIRFDRTRGGAIKHWELDRCINEKLCPLDVGTKNDLRFLIGLRHEIEHHMAIGLGLDRYLGSRYLACCLNYEHWVTTLFGQKESIADALAFSLQFAEVTAKKIPEEFSTHPLPKQLESYISHFDAELSPEEFNSPRFAYRLYFVKRLAGKPGQADEIVEFLSDDSESAGEADKQFWVRKEVERPKYRARDVLAMIHGEGFIRFNSHAHTLLWREMDAKKPAKGYGVELGGQWFWYERWLEVVRDHCNENYAKYTA